MINWKYLKEQLKKAAIRILKLLTSGIIGKNYSDEISYPVAGCIYANSDK